MTALEIAREVLGPKYSAEELDYIIWNETGYPEFFTIGEGETLESVFRKQLKEFRERKEGQNNE